MFLRPAVLVLVLAAGSLAAAEEPPVSDARPDDAPRAAIWIQNPAYALLTAASLGRGVNLLVGANFVGPGDHDLIVELTYVRAAQTQIGNVQQVWAAVGLPVQIAGPARLRGLFWVPKVFGLWAMEGPAPIRGADDDPIGPGTGPPHHSAELHLGFDFLVQGNLGPLYVATMFGLTAGVGFNSRVDSASAASDQIQALFTDVPSEARAALQPVYTVNLNLLRVGFAF